MSSPRKTIIVTEKAGDEKKKGQPGLVIDLTTDSLSGVSLDGLLLLEDKKGKSLNRFPLLNETSLLRFSKVPKEIRTILFRCTQQQLKEELHYLRQKYADLPEEEQAQMLRKQMTTYWYNQFQQLKPFAGMLLWFYTWVDPLLISTSELKRAAISNFTPRVHFELIRTPMNRLRLVPWIEINGHSHLLTEFKRHGFLLRSRSEFFLLNREDAEILEKFADGYIDQGSSTAESFIARVLNPIAATHKVNQDVLMSVREVSGNPECLVRLSELNGNFLMISLQWKYEDFVVEDNREAKTTIDIERERIVIIRNQEGEKNYREMIRSLNARFRTQNQDYFYLPFAEAQKNQWFIKFYRKLSEQNIPVLGMDTLAYFRYNQNLPELNIKRSTREKGWIDLTFEISYGEEKVPLADVRKAIQFKQPFVLLKDGSLGMLPEEWGLQYEAILRLGQMEKNTVRLSDRHWSLIDATGTDSSQPPLLRKEFWARWKQHQEKPGTIFQVPAEIRADLRDYQKAGFEWFCLLDEMQWGGCLADDMGLGKTLQTISFIRHLIHRYPGEKHLVVCPTSLMYNWEAELQKFAPDIAYAIYHGADREFSVFEDRNINVVITSYGTVRSDSEKFNTLSFCYIFLDESHVIKNPDSLTARAVLQLQSQNRIILSGTPIQNNTMDLYTQMQFINPGLLGNKASFREVFAQPIDKFGDSNKTQQLRKLIHPFLLRRTKEQVATDLPAKTEIIQWCEMGEDQRRIYNTVKEKYRSTLVKKVNEEGVGSNAIHILEGLTRLRQICNAPQLVPDFAEETAASVKIEELLRSLEEIGEGHKALVFSQFTGMLQRIASSFTERGIPYLYLDGQTKATDRQGLVKQFQESDEHTVFLISLKAGGVGLTLTAADYVYLVDPWWNPAAEQQAIDRSHRIGQQQKVFAYKMICRDSVEEKILQLQAQKKSLSEELISEDSGFIKKLTEEDVAFLFG
mgnify:CR=1 FL=1